MNKLFVCLMAVSFMFMHVGIAIAGDCHTDTIVNRWMDERDRAEEQVVQLWSKGLLPEIFAEKVAVILANEFYICSKCRDEFEFLKDNVHVLKNGISPRVETVPTIILERMVGDRILSPWQQFPSEKRKGVSKAW